MLGKRDSAAARRTLSRQRSLASLRARPRQTHERRARACRRHDPGRSSSRKAYVLLHRHAADIQEDRRRAVQTRSAADGRCRPSARPELSRPGPSRRPHLRRRHHGDRRPRKLLVGDAAASRANAARMSSGTARSAEANGSKATTVLTRVAARGQQRHRCAVRDAEQPHARHIPAATSEVIDDCGDIARLEGTEGDVFPVDAPCPRRSTTAQRKPACASRMAHGVMELRFCRYPCSRTTVPCGGAAYAPLGGVARARSADARHLARGSSSRGRSDA